MEAIVMNPIITTLALVGVVKRRAGINKQDQHTAFV